jgi:Flp pilus assembly pilin Flp
MKRSNSGEQATQQKRRNQDMSFVKNFLRNEEGQDMVEYTLLLAFVALAAGAAYVTIGQQVSAIWSKAQNDITSADANAH